MLLHSLGFAPAAVPTAVPSSSLTAATACLLTAPFAASVRRPQIRNALVKMGFTAPGGAPAAAPAPAAPAPVAPEPTAPEPAPVAAVPAPAGGAPAGYPPPGYGAPPPAAYGEWMRVAQRQPAASLPVCCSTAAPGAQQHLLDIIKLLLGSLSHTTACSAATSGAREAGPPRAQPCRRRRPPHPRPPHAAPGLHGWSRF